jgi:hypothetical protein
MALATRRTKDREQTQDDPLFGFLLAGSSRYLEAVGFKIEEPLFPPQECASTISGIYVVPQHGTFARYIAADEGIGGMIRAVVYQPNFAASVGLDELAYNTFRTNAYMSDLRRKVAGFAQLSQNWDREGAEPISRETISTALQIIEHIAIVLERKNTSSLPSVRPFPDGSVFFKWICGQKELAITVEGRNLEVQRWEPLDAFQSQGLWEIPVDATAEHVEWVLT